MNNVIKFVKEMACRFPFLFSFNLISFILVGIFEAIAILAFAPLIDLLINQGDVSQLSNMSVHFEKIFAIFNVPLNFVSVLSFFLFFTVFSAVMSVVSKFFMLKMQVVVMKEVVIGTIEDAFNARWYFFSSGSQGVLLNTFIRESGIIASAFVGIITVFSLIVQCIVIILVPLYVSWLVTLLCVVGAVSLSFLFGRLGKLSYKLGKRATKTGNEYARVITELLSSAKLILGFGNTACAKEKVAESWGAHQKVKVLAETLAFAVPRLFTPIALVVLITAFAVTQKAGFYIAETGTLLYAFYRMMPKIGELTKYKIVIHNFFPSFEQIETIRKRARELKQSTGKRVYSGFKKDIVLNNISFAYPEHSSVINDLSLSIPKGNMIAFVGDSGGGKSTLIDIIMGFNEPQQGDVLIDGDSLFSYDINSYRKRIGYVPQHSILFNDTVKENLLWGAPGASDAEIEAACSMAYVDEFVKNMPEGFDTIIGDRGVRLSGGQQQRLSLARAILRKPDVLILDEATSSLDSSSERYIQLAIEKMSKVTTIIVIAHRLSTIMNSDNIYVLKSGQVVESGTGGALMRKKGVFFNMVQMQQMEEDQTSI